MEQWKDVAGYEGRYEVSSLGRVRSLPKYVDCKAGSKRYVRERILKPGVSNGYKLVRLCGVCKPKSFYIHQLVAMAFLNHTPNGHELVIDHIDNDKSNNRLINLQIITQRQNVIKGRSISSKYKGVTFDRKNGKWKAQITIDKKLKHLGLFRCETKAHLSYQNQSRL